MDKKKVSHDILNILERMRIMHDLVKDSNYQQISKEELLKDLESDLSVLKEKFLELAQ